MSRATETPPADVFTRGLLNMQARIKWGVGQGLGVHALSQTEIFLTRRNITKSDREYYE